jgi:hypothetical protein
MDDVLKSMDTQWCMSILYLKFSYYRCNKSIQSISIGCITFLSTRKLYIIFGCDNALNQ